MFYKELFGRLIQHLSSLTVAIISGLLFILGDTSWLQKYMHVDDAPIFPIFIITLVLLVYELSLKNHKFITVKVDDVHTKLDDVLLRLEINNFRQAVNGLYGRFMSSGDKFIDNEYTIKELYELVDKRKKLKENSYIQGRLEYLMTKVKRV